MNNLLANKTPNGKLLEFTDPKMPRFMKIDAALGWLDPTGDDHANKHALLVGGEQEDGRFVVLHEVLGGMSEILREAVNFKDRFLISTLYLDIHEISLAVQVQNHDGLWGYRDYGQDREGRTIYQNPNTNIWPHYRNRETKLHISAVPDMVRVGITAGQDRINRMVSDQKLLIHSRCTITDWCLTQARKDITSHPVIKALIFLTWAWDTNKWQEPVYQAEKRVPYGNLRR